MIILSVGITAAYSSRIIKFSIKFILKNKPDNQFSNNIIIELPIMLITPFSIIFGSMILWIILPYQIILIPFITKIIILTILIIGFQLGTNINFTILIYIQIGYSAITLWLLRLLSSHTYHPLFFLINIFQKNDKIWQESYGPKHIFLTLKYNYINPDLNLKIPSFILFIILIFPIIFFII